MDALAHLLAKRRDRVIAAILGYKERDCDPHLPLEVSMKLRKVVLDNINDLTDTALEMLKAANNDGTDYNQLYLEKLDLILHHVVNGEENG